MIKIICIGKIKESFIQEAIKEYEKRISKYQDLKIIELDDIGLDDKKVVLKKEEDKILKVLNTKDFIKDMS